MAAALRTRKREDRVGHTTHLNVRINLNAYTTGGVPFDPTRYAEGMTILDAIIPPSGGFNWEYDYAAKAIKGYVIATAAQIANAFDLSALDLRATFILAP